MLGTDITANTITSALKPEMTRAHANLLAVDTGLPLRDRQAKKARTNGVRITIKAGFMDWYNSVFANFDTPSAGHFSWGRLLKYGSGPITVTGLPAVSVTTRRYSSIFGTSCATVVA